MTAPVPVGGDGVEAAIEASSLGTPDAKALRASVSDETAARIVARADELGDIEAVLMQTGVTANTWQSAARRLANENARLRAALRASAPEDGLRAAAPIRPYPPDAPLVAVHESEWEDAEHASAQVPELEDALANCNAYARRLEQRLRDLIAKGEERSVMTVGVSELRALLPDDEDSALLADQPPTPERTAP